MRPSPKDTVAAAILAIGRGRLPEERANRRELALDLADLVPLKSVKFRLSLIHPLFHTKFD